MFFNLYAAILEPTKNYENTKFDIVQHIYTLWIRHMLTTVFYNLNTFIKKTCFPLKENSF